MPRLSEAQSFDRTISSLITKRRVFSAGLAEIDALFAKYGIQLNGSAPAPARKASGRAPIGRRKRRSFTQTANELVMSIVKSKAHPSTGDVNAAWKKAGRGGTADNTLGNLVKDRKLKRASIKDGRGSTYSLA